MKFCPYCGKAYAGGKFCGSCGGDVSSFLPPPPKPTPKPVAKPAPAPKPTPKPAAAPAARPTSPSYSSPKPATASEISNAWQRYRSYPSQSTFNEVLKYARQGNAVCQVSVGFAYYKGEFVPKSYAEAFNWYKKAADQGLANGQFLVGFYYQRGIGVSTNYAEALKWYKKAAAQGHVEAHYYIGMMYHEGAGVQKNNYEALKWYKIAADKGDVHALADYGIALIEMADEKNDWNTAAQAVSWLKKAAERNEPYAQYYLATAYEDGFGVDKNMQTAIYWYKKAAEQGDEDAIERLRQILG